VNPTSFPKGMVSGSGCVNIFGWESQCADLSAKSNGKKCFHHDSCEDTKLAHVEDDQMTALSACCAFDGGFSTGVRLLMESASPLRCATLSNISSDVVFCECSDENQRYDIQTSSCISSCMPGMRWESVISDFYENMISDVGRCAPCSSGTYSAGSVDGWIDRCLNCSAGHRMDRRHVKRVLLGRNRYQIEAQLANQFPPVNSESEHLVRSIHTPMRVLLSAQSVPRENTPTSVLRNVSSVTLCIVSPHIATFRLPDSC